MASSLTQTYVLGALTGGNQNVSKIDTDFTQLYDGLNTLNYYANFYLDSGGLNALAITVNTPQIITLSGGALVAGTILHVYALTTNSQSSVTLTVTYNGVGLGAKFITHTNWTGLFPGEIVSGAMLILMYDGTRFQLLNPQRVEEISYHEITANVNITSSNSAAPDTIIGGTLFGFDGLTKVVVEAFAPYVVPPTGAGPMFLVLVDGVAGVSPQGNMGAFYAISTGTVVPATLRRVFTPTTGGHTYYLGGYLQAGATTGTVACTTGGVGALMPAYMRITRA